MYSNDVRTCDFRTTLHATLVTIFTQIDTETTYMYIQQITSVKVPTISTNCPAVYSKEERRVKVLRFGRRK